MSAITALPAQLPQTVPSETKPQNITYLQRCVEEIDSTDKIATKFAHYATAYKVAAYATIGLFIAVAAAASVLVGIYFSAFLPAVGITALCLVQPALAFVKKLLATAAVKDLCAQRTRGIGEEYNKIKANPEEAENTIRKLTKQDLPTQPEKLTQLKTALAHYNYWDHIRTEKETALQEKKLANAKDLPLKFRVTLYT